MTADVIKTTLRKKGFRVTDPRVLLLQILEKSGCKPQTADEIRKRSKLDKVTVYRTLESFVGAAIANRVEFGDGVTRYEISHGHHHHIVCTECGTVADVEDCLEKGIQKTLEKKTGFTVSSHSLEFFGLCRNCR
jgi:Fur family transcriptional regulator, ferric uptake regulator